MEQPGGSQEVAMNHDCFCLRFPELGFESHARAPESPREPARERANKNKTYPKSKGKGRNFAAFHFYFLLGGGGRGQDKAYAPARNKTKSIIT
jgi:hypothetical protein